jgi:hypothetical protein
MGQLVSPTRGVQMVLEAMLQAPEFIYRSEVGKAATGPITELTQYELASYLSYTLWNTSPDAELTRLADEGQLKGAAINTQIKRLLGDRRARPGLGDFFVQMLGLEQLETLSKDTAIFKTWTDALRPALRDEVSAFGQSLVFDGPGTVETMFTANYSIISGPVAAIYKVTGVTGTTPVRTDLNTTERSGVLTMPGFLATFAKPHTTDPIARGKEVRQRVLCQHLPEPPANLNAVEPPVSANLTARQRYDMHRSMASCAGCHELIDPVGLGFENYDGLGAYRTLDGKLAIDNSGEVFGTDDANGKFNGVVELSKKLAGSGQVRDCVASQFFRYALGRTEDDGDKCGLTAIKDSFAKGKGNLKLLVETVVASEMTRFRTK